MSERAAAEPCPECGTSFDTRTDSPGAKIRSWTALISIGIAIVVMPFVALLSMILIFVTLLNLRGIDKTKRMYRIPGPVARRSRHARMTVWVALFEWFGLMLLHTVNPEALNWW